MVDVNDTIACVEYLVQQGKVDPKRVAIVGGSAGGYTVLACLCASKVFTAGTSLYGVSDLALLAGETHKFESEYLFALLGGTPEQIPEVNRRIFYYSSFLRSLLLTDQLSFPLVHDIGLP